MSGILTTIIGRLCQSGREDVKTNPADKVVTRLLLAVDRRKTEERGSMVCLKAPSEYCVEPSGKVDASSWEMVTESGGRDGGEKTMGPGGMRICWIVRKPFGWLSLTVSLSPERMTWFHLRRGSCRLWRERVMDVPDPIEGVDSHTESPGLSRRDWWPW